MGAHGWRSWGVMGLHHPHFALGLVGAPEALKAWIEAQVGGKYLLYSHIFLPSSVHIINNYTRAAKRPASIIEIT